MSITKSPITNSDNTKLLETIDAEYIIKGYKKYLNIDVTRFFDQKTVNLYQCLDTNYCFYHPFNTAGDGAFYEELQKIDWYYQDWKFEFDIASKLISQGDKVLEIGCGKGSFLKHLKDSGIDGIGLELNDNTVAQSKKLGINILNETIEQHSLLNKDCYDWVISFQVVEHISDIKSFIDASLNALKENGKMIIAVPNNNALFFKYSLPLINKYHEQQPALLMNMPPHHMGKWNERSLKKIASVFKIKLVGVYNEPLPHYRVGLVSEILSHKILMRKFPTLQMKLEKLLFKVVRRTKSYFAGDTIVAVYTK